jgi:TRAP transporter TAXI family solute receptor
LRFRRAAFFDADPSRINQARRYFMRSPRLKVLLVAVAVAAMAWASGPQRATAAETPSSLEIGGASIGGAFYVVAGGVAKLLEEKLKIPVTAAVTEGSRENVRLIDRKQIFMGVIASNNSYPAYHGVLTYERKYPVALAMGLYPNAFTLHSLPSSPVNSFNELRGKRVGVGTGRTWDTFMVPLMKAHGLTYKKDFKPVYAGMSDLYTQLGDGIIAATPGIVAGLSPIPGALRLHAEKGAAYFGPEPEAVEKVLKELPYMARIRITKGTPTFDKDIDTVDIGGPHVYVRADADAELVYKVTKLLHKNLDNLAGEVRYFKYAQANPAVLTKDINVPFHPGAVRYWKEAGLWKP